PHTFTRCLHDALPISDLGTGSGAIALAIKRQRPKAHVVATDSSAAALAVAQRNAVKHGLEVEFRHGRWLEPLAGERFDLIVANRSEEHTSELQSPDHL